MKRLLFLAMTLAMILTLSLAVFAEPVTTPVTEYTESEPVLVQLAEEIENLRTTIKNIGEDAEDKADTKTEEFIIWIKQNLVPILSVAIMIISFIFRHSAKAENGDMKIRLNAASKYLTLLFGGTAADGSKVEGKVNKVLTEIDKKVDDILTEQQEKLSEMTLLIEAAKIAVSDSTETVKNVGKSIESNAMQIKAQTEAIKLQALANKNLIDMTNAPDYQKEMYNAEYAEQEKLLKKLEVKASEAQKNENKAINT